MIRTLWLAAAILCAGFSALGLRGLAGEIYRVAANTGIDSGDSRTSSAQALAVATRASPWMPELWVQRAYQADSVEQIVSFSREALRWAPADARLWMSHIQLLIYTGVRDPDLSAALERVRKLAPASPEIHLNKAMLGIQVWRHAPDVFRHDAVESARFVLQNQPGAFYGGLAEQRLDFLACSFVSAELKLTPWCGFMQSERARCDHPDLESETLAHCETLGLRK